VVQVAPQRGFRNREILGLERLGQVRKGHETFPADNIQHSLTAFVGQH
jgi:hypothetical protein